LGTTAVTRGGEALAANYFAPLEKCVGHSLELLDIVHKIRATLRKLFALSGVSNGPGHNIYNINAVN